LYQLICKREQDDRVGQVEHCMEDRYLHRVDLASGNSRIKCKYKESDHAEYDRTYDIEGKVDDRSPLCRSGSSYTGDQRRSTGTDILSQRNIDRRVRRNDPI